MPSGPVLRPAQTALVGPGIPELTSLCTPSRVLPPEPLCHLSEDPKKAPARLLISQQLLARKTQRKEVDGDDRIALSSPPLNRSLQNGEIGKLTTIKIYIQLDLSIGTLSLWDFSVFTQTGTFN